jgi:hypothetical protein
MSHGGLAFRNNVLTPLH